MKLSPYDVVLSISVCFGLVVQPLLLVRPKSLRRACFLRNLTYFCLCAFAMPFFPRSSVISLAVVLAVQAVFALMVSSLRERIWALHSGPIVRLFIGIILLVGSLEWIVRVLYRSGQLTFNSPYSVWAEDSALSPRQGVLVCAVLYALVIRPFFLFDALSLQAKGISFYRNLVLVCLCGLVVPFYELFAVWMLAGLLIAETSWMLLQTRRSGPQRRLGLARVRPLSRGAVVVALSFVVVVGGSEWIARSLVRAGLVTAFTPLQTARLEGIADWRRAHIMGDTYREPDPVLLWRPVDREPYTAQRFKGPVVKIPKPSGTWRILCYGDSNTDGVETDSWPEQLQKVLSSAKDPTQYEVLNAGVVGYSSHQGLLRFDQEVETYTPDVVFIAFGWNDCVDAYGRPDKDYRAPSSWVVGVERTLLQFKAYLVLRNWFLNFRSDPASRTGEDTARVSSEDYLNNLEQFVRIARDHKATAILLTRPHKLSEADLAGDRTWRRRVPDYNDALRKFARDRKVLLIDTQEIFANRYADLFGDECHFTEVGRKKMAEILSQELVERRLLPGNP